MPKSKYEEDLVAQIDQYKNVENIHELPEIFHYWSNKHLLGKLQAIFDVGTVVDFYAKPIGDLLQKSRKNENLLSLGSGDSSMEVEIAKRLLEKGHTNFKLSCLEVAPNLIERGSKNIRDNKLESFVEILETDINSWRADDTYLVIMANHSLHHFVELEKIFASVYNSLLDHGLFITNDMIGRNGHMRWPEVLEMVEGLWSLLPDEIKLNQQHKRFDGEFVNFDCSGEGFEGVRAQDILPLLLQTFHFHSFLGFGGIIDVFIDRSYGHNWEINTQNQRSIDFIHRLDELLLTLGHTKPTTMFAYLSKKKQKKTTYWGNLSPQFCVRKLPEGLG